MPEREHDLVAISCRASVDDGHAYRTAIWCRIHKGIEAWPETIGVIEMGADDLMTGVLEMLGLEKRSEVLTEVFEAAIEELMREYEREQAAPMN